MRPAGWVAGAAARKGKDGGGERGARPVPVAHTPTPHAPLQEHSSPIADEFAALPTPALAAALADAAGSRAGEALLAGPGLGAKSRKKLLRRLTGQWAAVGATPGGVHVVERAYEGAAAGGREAIAAELAAAEATLGGAPRTIAMLRK